MIMSKKKNKVGFDPTLSARKTVRFKVTNCANQTEQTRVNWRHKQITLKKVIDCGDLFVSDEEHEMWLLDANIKDQVAFHELVKLSIFFVLDDIFTRKGVFDPENAMITVPASGKFFFIPSRKIFKCFRKV